MIEGTVSPHLPLYQTREMDILEAVRDRNKPIICESLLNPDTMMLEKEYLEEYFSK